MALGVPEEGWVVTVAATAAGAMVERMAAGASAGIPEVESKAVAMVVATAVVTVAVKEEEG